MKNENVGAGILNIITESLYDKPIVVFREYVQNSVDSFLKTMNSIDKNELCCKIWVENKNLFFLDNGNGINQMEFLQEMQQIAYSSKRRTINIGYKGIGRLSGISYCRELIFVNIVSFKKSEYQIYTIDCEKYNDIKKNNEFSMLSFSDLMKSIGEFDETQNIDPHILSELSKYRNIFKIQDKGFLVMLKGINDILNQTVLSKEIYTELGWLLPVNFKKEIYEIEESALFEDITQAKQNGNIPAVSFNIEYNNTPIERPIEGGMLRYYTCKCDMQYAIGFHSFRRDKIAVEKGNSFSGIRMYIDNMLLCDETEIIPILQKYGMIEHTTNELVQSVKGIGAIIYITDKVNISANARRTFIEITDGDSIAFLERLAEFIERIYKARYALSKYSSGKKNIELETEKLNQLRDAANEALMALATEQINIDNSDDEKTEFNNLSENEKKQIIKKKITKNINDQIKSYLLQTTTFDYENAYEDFKIWIRSN